MSAHPCPAAEEEGAAAVSDQSHHRGRLRGLPQLQVGPQHLRAETVWQARAGVRLAGLDT